MTPPLESGPTPQWKRATTLVFGTFLLVTLPLMVVLHVAGDSPAVSLLHDTYSCLFGLTHFFITFVIYLSSANLAYFASSKKNRLVYFAVPALIFLYSGVRLTFSFDPGGVAALGITCIGFVVRCADFNHFSRQSFGVLQIYKSHSGLGFGKRARDLENALFYCLIALQAGSYFLGSGELPLGALWAQLALGFIGILFAVVCAEHLRQARAAHRADLRALAPFAYFLIQVSAIFATVIHMRFYVVALAVHYVEYHVLIVSRTAHASLQPASTVDRLLGWLIAKPLRLAAVVVAIAGVVDLTRHGAFGLGAVLDGSPLPLRFTFYMLDGVFLFHYFVESFIWKFSEPYYRQSLKFLAPPKPVPAAARAA